MNHQNGLFFAPGAILLTLTVAVTASQAHVARAADNPNIVYILADDLGYGDLSCLNRESKLPTPNVDRLAGQGITFLDANSPSSVCSPTRYGVLTGRYCWRSRLKSFVLLGYDRPLIEADRLTVPGPLKQHGYNTAETRNLYNSRPEVVKRLTELLRKYQQQGHSRNLG